MLKYWVGLLLVLNAAGLAWQSGALAPWGLAPQEHREPERLTQQMRPEAIQPVPEPAAPAHGDRPVPEVTGASTSPTPSVNHNPSVAPEPMSTGAPATPTQLTR